MTASTLFAPLNDGAPTPTVVASWGLGVDSTAIVLRWLEDPDSRNFPLDQLVLCTSMTGDEFAATGQAVTDHILPRLRRAGVRFIQVARSQRKTTIAGDGVIILDDSTRPAKLHLDGAYTLGNEMLSAGTLPQLGGLRACSLHAKASCLEPVIARITRAQPYRHVIGYEAGEQGRALKDQRYNTATRTGWYPLIDWQWSRQTCLDYLAEVTGHTWEKSACVYCCFAFATERGRQAMIDRYRRQPSAGAYAMYLEFVARSLNPAQTLIKGSSVAEFIDGAQLREVRAAYERTMAECPYALYEVRRLTRGARNGGRQFTARSVRCLSTGDRAHMHERLVGMPGHLTTEPDTIPRKILRQRGHDNVDHFYVAAPAGVETKQRPGFDEWWQEATGETLF